MRLPFHLFPLPALCFLAVCLPLPAQQVRLMPDIAVAGAEYHEAQEAWLHNDPYLERELFKGNRADTVKRIRKAAALRDDVMSKKDIYLGLLVQRLEATRTRFASASPSGRIPVEDLKAELIKQQTRLEGDQDRLFALLKDLPAGDEYSLVRREFETERNDLAGLQDNVTQRIRSLDAIGAAQNALPAPSEEKDPYVERLDGIIRIWTQQRESDARTRASWERMYKLMEQAVNGVPDNGPPAGTKDSGKPKRGRKTSDLFMPARAAHVPAVNVPAVNV